MRAIAVPTKLAEKDVAMEEWGDPCQLGSGPRSRLDIAELGNIGQTEDVVQLAVREQTAIRGDPGP